MTYDMSIN